jgi:hypothetical protein
LTPAYASPEMLEHRDPDPRDDIYALGCITYELLTGRHPFNRMSALQARGAGMKPQRPATLGHAPWRALKCALAFEREARTPTVARFLSQFGEPSRGARSAVLAGAGLALAALAAAAAVYWWPRPGPGAEGAPRVAATAPEQAAAPTAPPPAPQAAPPAAAAATPVAASALAALTAALARVPCSALYAAEQEHALTVRGYLSRSIGNARFQEILAAIPGVGTVNLDVQPVDNDKCAVITTLAPYWAAHRRAGGGAAIRLSTPHAGTTAVLTEGDPLMVDLKTAGAESYVTVDYYALDGSVVHLLPNLRARENRAPAGHTATIGGLGNWVIGQPFGSELVVLLTTPVPLLDGLRPESESSAEYVRAIEKQLARIGTAAGTDKIAVDFVQITTRPRQR